MQRTEINPITLSVLWNAFISIAEEMGSTLRRTAFSEAVREGEDFSTGLFDADARLIAQGNFTPGHLGSMPYVVKHVLDVFPPRELRPGDAVVLNDSFLGSGHYPDVFMVTPVFGDTGILGYAVNCTHHIDVGGAAPGSQLVAGVTEAFQEGLRILPIRLVREGRFDADLLRMVLGNVRVPDKVEGDLRAQRNANHVGAERITKMHADYGSETLASVTDAMLDRSEARMRELISEIPDGEYSFEDYFDDSGPGTEPIRVRVAVTVEGDEVTVDFSDSGDQVAAALNSYINYTRAYATFAIKVLTDPLLPQNDGTIRPIKIVSRPGSFFNPRFPAPSGGRATVQIRIFEAINGALSRALPDRAIAAFSHWANPNIGGVDDRTGERFVFYDLIMGGYGARSDKDGAEALSPVLNAANIPVEIHESHNPVLVRQLALVPDSGGPGRFRGGCGIRKEIGLTTGDAVVSLLGDRHRFAPYGLFGGGAGQLASTTLNPDGDATQLSSKEMRGVSRGDVIRFQLAGGGGYGEPTERAPAAVLEDVLDGYVSVGEAERRYGVVLDAEGGSVDLHATEATRRRMAEQRTKEATE